MCDSCNQDHAPSSSPRELIRVWWLGVSDGYQGAEFPELEYSNQAQQTAYDYGRQLGACFKTEQSPGVENR